MSEDECSTHSDRDFTTLPQGDDPVGECLEFGGLVVQLQALQDLEELELSFKGRLGGVLLDSLNEVVLVAGDGI